MNATTRKLIRFAYDNFQADCTLECREVYPDEETDVREARAHRMTLERAAEAAGVSCEAARRVIEAES